MGWRGVRRGVEGSSVLVTWIVASLDVSKGIESQQFHSSATAVQQTL